jgi:lysophospholipase L1-like esterase
MFQPAITGSLYWDGDNQDQSLYKYGLTPENDAPAEPRVMRFLSPEGERLIMSCDDGSFGVPSLSEGVYMMIPEMGVGEIASTKNVSHYSYEALKRGSIDIVTIGDSVPVVGGKPYFTQVLTEMLEPFGTINSNNIAVGGTVSEHWVPGTQLYEGSLKPLLPEADLVIISLGGNDLMQYVSNALNGGNIQVAIDGFEPFVLGVMDRVLSIVEDIHANNPEIDIVYCLYPNYTNSDMWKGSLGFAHTFVSQKVLEALDIVRASIPAAHRFILMDLYGASETLDLDDLLFDQLHFNSAGHEVYAEEIFRALGGARIGDALGMEKNFGIYKPDVDLAKP